MSPNYPISRPVLNLLLVTIPWRATRTGRALLGYSIEDAADMGALEWVPKFQLRASCADRHGLRLVDTCRNLNDQWSIYCGRVRASIRREKKRVDMENTT